MAKGLITQKEYARRRRVTPQYVSKLVRRGVVELRDGLVDPKQADASRAAVAQPGRTAGKKTAAKKAAAKGGKASAAKRAASRKQGEARTGTTGAAATGSAIQKARSASGTVVFWKAQREEAEAKLKQLELQRQNNELLPRAEVKEAQERQNANVKMRIRRLARSVAPRLTGVNSAAEIERTLLEEIDLVLDELATNPFGAGVQTSAEIPAGPMLPAMQEAQEATCSM